jgi:hypothetical protein
MSQQAVSANIIPNSAALEYFPQKQKEQRQKQLDVSFLMSFSFQRQKTKAVRCLFFDVIFLSVHFEFFAIFSYCLHFAKFVYLQRSKLEWQKSPAGTRQTYGKN